MMQPNHARMTYADYLALEERSQIKHEYIQGRVWAMAGGTPTHSRLMVKVIVLLENALAGKRCQVFNSELRVRLVSEDISVYPDASVVCGREEHADDDPNAITNPVVVIEVLSDSTEAYDRGEKAAYYQRIPSLREYLLVSQNEQRIEVQRRGENNTWEHIEAGPGESIELTSIGVSLRTDEVYYNPLAA